MSDTVHRDLMRAYELHRLRRKREALIVLDRVLSAEPTHARALGLRSMCLSSLGQHDAAIAAARAAAAAAPDADGPFWSLSYALGGAGQTPGAIEAAAEAVRLRPDAWTNHGRLADALTDTDPAAGLAAAERARELAPDRPLVHITCGKIFERLGRVDEARASYAYALTLDPQNFTAHMRIAHLDRKAKKWEAALSGYSRVLRLNPKSAGARRQVEALIRARLATPLAFAFAGAAAMSFDADAARAMVWHLAGAVVLGIVGGIGFLTIRDLRRAAGSFLWHFLRTDREALVVVSLASAYVLYIVAVSQTPLMHVGGSFYKLCGVLVARLIADQLTAGRKRKQKPRAKQLENGAKA